MKEEILNLNSGKETKVQLKKWERKKDVEGSPLCSWRKSNTPAPSKPSSSNGSSQTLLPPLSPSQTYHTQSESLMCWPFSIFGITWLMIKLFFKQTHLILNMNPQDISNYQVLFFFFFGNTVLRASFLCNSMSVFLVNFSGIVIWDELGCQ